MLQQSKAEEQRAIKASYCALKAVAGAQQLIEQVFGVEGAEKFLSIIQKTSKLGDGDIPENLALESYSSYERAMIEFGYPQDDAYGNALGAYQNQLRLNEYPITIAQLESKLFEASCSLERLQLNLKNIETEIDGKVVFDTTLRNEQQRKTVRNQKLEQNESYWELLEQLEQAKAEHQAIFIELDLRRNQFSVMKLELQRQIATLQLGNY